MGDSLRRGGGRKPRSDGVGLDDTAAVAVPESMPINNIRSFGMYIINDRGISSTRMHTSTTWDTANTTESWMDKKTSYGGNDTANQYINFLKDRIFEIHLEPMLTSRGWDCQRNGGREKKVKHKIVKTEEGEDEDRESSCRYIPPGCSFAKETEPNATRKRRRGRPPKQQDVQNEMTVGLSLDENRPFNSREDLIEHFRLYPHLRQVDDLFRRYIVVFMDELSSFLQKADMLERYVPDIRERLEDGLNDSKGVQVYRDIVNLVEDSLLIPSVAGGLHEQSAVERLESFEVVEEEDLEGNIEDLEDPFPLPLIKHEVEDPEEHIPTPMDTDAQERDTGLEIPSSLKSDNYVIVTKLLPHGIGPNGREILFPLKSKRAKQVEKSFVFQPPEDVARCIQRTVLLLNEDSTLQSFKEYEEMDCFLSVEFLPDPDSSQSVIMSAKGFRSLVEKAGEVVNDYINWAISRYNMHLILHDGESLEVDVALDSVISPSQHIKFENATWESNFFESLLGRENGNKNRWKSSVASTEHGLWIHSILKDSLLEDILGKKCLATGAVILKVNETPVKTSDELKEAWRQGIASLRQSDKQSVPMTLCFPRFAHLDSIDEAKLTSGPRRRDGKPLQGNVKNQEALKRGKEQNHSESGQQKREKNVGEKGLYQRKMEAFTQKQQEEKKDAQKLLQQRQKQVSPSKGSPPTEQPRVRASKPVDPLACVAQAGTTKFPRSGGSDSAKAQDKIVSFRHFAEKYKPVKAIDFTGVHGHTFNKSLWERHKEIFGESCNASCPCPSVLPDLCQNVLKDERDRQSGKMKPVAAVEVGFVRVFVRRFYDKVKKEFPKDSPQAILRKLCKMWAKHKDEIRFGATCTSICPCIDGWDTIFKKVLGLSAKVSGMKKPGLNPVGGAIRRKSKEGRGTLSMAALVGAVTSSENQSHEYNLTYDASSPLGFHCVTQAKGLTDSVCKITSVNPHDKQRDPRIVAGTIVVATATLMGPVVVVSREDVKTHLELKQRYFAARDKSQKLRLWFVNTDVRARSARMAGEMCQKKHWASEGQWQGHVSDDGWAGGALEVSHTKKMQNLQVDNHQAAPVPSDDTNGGVYQENIAGTKLGGSPKSETRSSLLKWSKAELTPSSGKPAQSTVSILRGKKKAHGKKPLRVSISENQVNAQYIVTENAFRVAVMHQDYRDVLRFLRSGNDAHSLDKGKRPIDYVTERIEGLRRELDEGNGYDRDNKKKKLRSFHLKKNLLKAYQDTEFLVKNVTEQHSWPSALQVSIVRLENIEVPPAVAEKIEIDNVFCTLTAGGVKKRTLPSLPFSACVNWASIDRSALPPPYACRYNEMKDSYKEKEVKVDLFSGTPSSVDDQKHLCQWTKQVSVMKEKLASQYETEVACEMIDGDSDNTVSGTIVLSVTKEKENFHHQDFLNKLAATISLMEAFNREAERDNVKQKNITLPVYGDLSLLHVAVYLADKVSLERLLLLGADPTQQSDVGSAADLAKLLSQISPEGKELIDVILRFCPSLQQSLSLQDQKQHSMTIKNENDQVGLLQHDSETSIHAESVHAVKEESVPEEPLPVLPSFDWMIPPTAKRCINYSRGCKFGPACRFAHVQPSLGLAVGSEKTTPEDFNRLFQTAFGVPPASSYFHSHRASNYNGVLFFSAAFLYPAENVIYYAEGGARGRQSSQGLFWYPTEQEAITAVMQVVTLVLQNRGFGEATTRHEVQGGGLVANISQQVPVVSDSEGKRKFEALCANSDETEKLICRIEKHNLSNLYFKMFPAHQLKRTCWDTKRETIFGNELFTAALTSPGENGMRYSPSLNGGVIENGEYYYQTEKRAKAVTFLCFLQKQQLHGAISSVDEFLDSHENTRSKGVAALEEWNIPTDTLQPEVKRRRSCDVDSDFSLPEGFNYSNVYMKVFPKIPLKNIYWSVVSREINEKKYFTSTLKSPAEEGRTYLPFRQGGVFQNGSYFYENEKRAKDVTFLSFLESAKERGLIQDIGRATEGGMVAASRFQKIKQENPEGNLVSKEEMAVMEMMDKCNPSNVYIQIFPANVLRKACWRGATKVVYGKTLHTASFIGPAEEVEYLPEGKGGKFYEGRWWYSCEKAAKDVTFCCFLKKMATAGKISDMRHDLDGQALF